MTGIGQPQTIPNTMPLLSGRSLQWRLKIQQHPILDRRAMSFRHNAAFAK
jgi:hypothetical protein